MDFSLRKLPIEAASNLRICPIHTVKPFALMLAPVYVFMRRNEKFVSVKAPLDFFTDADLERLSSFESFFMPQFVDLALTYRQAGRTLRSILAWQPRAAKIGKSQFPEVALPPAPYEISDAAIRILGPLWSPVQAGDCGIEPFFVSVFANEVCDLLPGELLLEARDKSIAAYERAVLVSSWAVFLALHLGLCDLRYLNRLRVSVFEEVAQSTVIETTSGYKNQDQEITSLAIESFAVLQERLMKASFFRERSDRISQKIASRLARIQENLILPDRVLDSIYGPGGFAHG